MAIFDTAETILGTGKPKKKKKGILDVTQEEMGFTPSSHYEGAKPKQVPTYRETEGVAGALGGILEKGRQEKIAMREKIKPIPDVEAGKTGRRRAAALRRRKRGGRTSTVLSQGETLG